MSVSGFWYCTIVVHDVDIGGGQGKNAQAFPVPIVSLKLFQIKKEHSCYRVENGLCGS